MTNNEFRADIAKFLAMMEAMENTISPQIQDAVSDLADTLDIGRIEAVIYDEPEREKNGDGQKIVFYEYKGEEGWDNSDVFDDRRLAGMGTVVHYLVSKRGGTPDWDDVDLARIKMLTGILFVFNVRSRLMKANYNLTYFDQEMNMYNLRYFFKHCTDLIAGGRIVGFAAIYFNLKRFSVVNLQLGRANGNIVMRRFIAHIQSCFTDRHELISRIGGDNFAMLCKVENLQTVTESLAGTAICYNDSTGDRILVSATAGVYIIDGRIPVQAPTDIMDRISVAVTTAKQRTKHDIAYFDEDMMDSNQRALQISSMFSSALENEEFLVYYQPKVSVEGYKLAGAEALCRWKHNGEFVSPADFIPVLERSMDICRLDFYMLDHVCRDIRRWLDEGRKVVKISVNLSRRHLSDIDLLKHIVEIVDRNNVPHEYIEVELTETTTDVEFKYLKRVISGLQATGISTSVDDFGVGYSSLTLIKDIPWNALKVDKSFLPDVGKEYDKKKQVMLKYVVAMAREMGLVCVAEGVETKEQLELLKSNSCDIIQGYYFDKPLPVEEFETRLDNYCYSVE